MIFKQFRVFATVARHLHITRASRALRVSQPTISRQLNDLEATYQTKLYRPRNAGGIELTGEGHQFLHHVDFIVSELAKIEDIFHSELCSTSRNLAIAGNTSTTADLLPEAIRLFRINRPNVNITLKSGTSRDIQQMVLNSEVEIGIIKNLKPVPAIAMEPYRYEKIVAFVSNSHPLANRKHLTLSDVADTPFIIVGWEQGKGSVEQQILRDLRKKGYKLNVAMISESPDAVKAAVKLGMGLGLLFEDTILPEIRTGGLKEVKLHGMGKLGTKSWIISHIKKPLSPNALYFRKLLIELCRKRERGSRKLLSANINETLTRLEFSVNREASKESING